MKALGHVFKYGDNVDTDVIIPARYLNSFDGKELASHAMVDIDPEFAKKVQPGDLIVANKNFGCGSSREHAPLCLKRLQKVLKQEMKWKWILTVVKSTTAQKEQSSRDRHFRSSCRN